MKQATILVADDEQNLRRVLAAHLLKAGYQVLTADDGQNALDILEKQEVNVVVTDLKMPGLDGMEVLRQVQQKFPGIPVLILTAHGTVDNAVQAVKAGAFDYITKPFDKNELLSTIAKAARTEQLARRDFRPEPSEAGRFRIIGQTARMKEIYDIIDRAEKTDVKVKEFFHGLQPFLQYEIPIPLVHFS